MMKMAKRMAHSLGRSYIGHITRDEFKSQTFTRHNERPIEFRFVFEQLTRLRPTTVLDVGTGTTALPHLLATCGCVVTATDNVRDYWPTGMSNRHWHVIDSDITRETLDRQFDMITCISVIEHISDHGAAFRNMISMLNPGGHLIITTPYNETTAHPNVYTLPDSAYGRSLPYICRSTSRQDVDAWLSSSGATLVCQEFWRLWTGTVWTQGTFLQRPEQGSASSPHQLSCMLFTRT